MRTYTDSHRFSGNYAHAHCNFYQALCIHVAAFIDNQMIDLKLTSWLEVDTSRQWTRRCVPCIASSMFSLPTLSFTRQASVASPGKVTSLPPGFDRGKSTTTSSVEKRSQRSFPSTGQMSYPLPSTPLTAVRGWGHDRALNLYHDWFITVLLWNTWKNHNAGTSNIECKASIHMLLSQQFDT